MPQYPSFIKAIVLAKCPRCRKGQLFTHGPLKISKMTSMHPNCDVCGQASEPELAFYYGAMFVSYGLSALIFLFNFWVFGVYLEIKMTHFFILNSIALLALWPFIFRYARVLYLNIFVHFDPNWVFKTKKTI